MISQVVIASIVLACGLALPIDDEKYDPEIGKARSPQYPIHPLLADRSSQREFTGEDISDEDLNSIFEAARWAPSSMNSQPWRFVYARQNTPRFDEFASILMPANQVWANKSSVLIAQIAANFEDYKDKIYQNTDNMFDSGSAYMSLALEASGRGFSAVAIGGADFDRAYQVLNLNKAKHIIPIFIALGKNPDNEHRVSNKTVTPRRTIKEFVFENYFVDTDPMMPGN